MLNVVLTAETEVRPVGFRERYPEHAPGVNRAEGDLHDDSSYRDNPPVRDVLVGCLACHLTPPL